uniref:Putative peripheral benzodiazepine receptor prax-1 n=1 Tax=Phlebotomus kandelakii TaxID=1109342 RepID=A0A6B2ED43_9DIPT
MPVLSLHNTYSLPSGSASYTLGLSGAPGGSSYTYGTTVGSAAGVLGAAGLAGAGSSSLIGTSGLAGLGGTSLPSGLGGYNTSSYSTYTNPLLTSGAMKLKSLDEIDLGIGRYGNRAGTPCSPIPPASWGLDSYSGLDGVNPTFMHTQRPLSRLGGLDLDSRQHGFLALNGTGEPQVDMLDIPGKGRCCVFIARFSYDPPDESEGELSLCAGDYLLVWGSGEPQGGYFDAELLDGRRGLVPASFVQRLIGDDLLEFHQAVVTTLRDADDAPVPLDPAPLPPNNPLMTHTSEDMARLSETHGDLGPDQLEDEADTVPAPRHLTLERQLNKSVLIGWSMPEPAGYNQIESYHVYVDGVLKVTVKANERTRALVEGVDSTRPHRISVRSVTQNRRTSRDAACTMIIGRDTSHLGPSAVRASNITCSSAVISWLPANSNHQHVVCVNNVEVRTVKPGVYRHTITGLAPSTQYRVTVRAKHLRAPGQNPPPAPPPEEAPGAYTDFRTLAKGLPDPPQEIQVEAGPQDGTLLVTWQPVSRPPSSGPVTGYAVYADGKKVTDVDSPTGDHALIDIGKLVGLNPKAVTVRTKSRDSQSSDSQPTAIPSFGYDETNTENGLNYTQDVVRNAARNRVQHAPHTGIPPHMRSQRPGPQQQQQQQPGMMQQQNPGQMQMNQQMPMTQQQQQVIEHDENLSDKEVFPGSMHQQHGLMQGSQQVRGGSGGGIPAIEITKDGPGDTTYVSDDSEYQETGRRRSAPAAHQPQQQGYQTNPMSRNPVDRVRPQNPGMGPSQQQQHQQMGQRPQHPQQQMQQQMQQQLQQQQLQQQQLQQQQQQQPFYGGPSTMPGQQQRGPMQQQQRVGMMQGRGPMSQQQQQQQMKKARYFMAMFDYDPSTMSPNPDSCEEELPFQEGDTIKVYGDKDPDGFYWGELRGRRGYVPHNMVTEIEEGQVGAQGGVPLATGTGQSVRGVSRDRWGDIYATSSVKRMIALYDYDPQELSPNVDAEQVELSFKTGDVVLVYGEMDEDGFYMGELDGVRGLVPSNFLAEAPEQYNNQMASGNMGRGGMNNRGGRTSVPGGTGPGARGPPPPPRDNMNMGPVGVNQRGQPMRKDARPTSPTLLDTTGHPAPDHQTQGMQGKGGMIGRAIGINMQQQPGQQKMQQQQMGQPGQQQMGQQQLGQQQMGQQQMGGMGGGMQQQPMMMQQPQQQQQQQYPATTTSAPQTGGMFSTASSLFSGATNAATGGLFNKQPPKGPQVIPQPGMAQQPFGGQPTGQMGGGVGGMGAFGGGLQGAQQPQQGMPGQPGMPGQQGPNLMQKLNEITAPGGDILSKGKELIFMKFGLGGK